jgi:hypothetical protein
MALNTFRAAPLIAYAAAAFLSCLPANADFVAPCFTTGEFVPRAFLSETVRPGTGDLAGFDLHRYFFAFNSASQAALAGGQGLQSVKITVSSNQAMKFYTANLFTPNTGGPDVDLYGEAADDTAYRNGSTQSADALSTGIFVHDSSMTEAFSPQGLLVNGAGLSPAANHSSAVNSPTTVFANVKSLRVEGFVQNPLAPPPPGSDGVGADTAARTASAGQIGAGALFAMVIVPTGASVGILATFAADKGPTYDFTPEPTALAPLTLAAALLGARHHHRRRRR